MCRQRIGLIFRTTSLHKIKRISNLSVSFTLPARVVPHLHFLHFALFFTLGLLWFVRQLSKTWSHFVSSQTLGASPRQHRTPVRQRQVANRAASSVPVHSSVPGTAAATRWPWETQRTVFMLLNDVQTTYTLHRAAVCSPLRSSFSGVWTTLDLFDKPLSSRGDIQEQTRKTRQEGGANKGHSPGQRREGAPGRRCRC